MASGVLVSKFQRESYAAEEEEKLLLGVDGRVYDCQASPRTFTMLMDLGDLEARRSRKKIHFRHRP